MFNKNDVIFSDGIGVCKVSDIMNLSVNKGEPLKYYLLSSVFDKNKTAYIPVYDHKVLLRNLISVEEAKQRTNNENMTVLEKKELEYVLGK